MIPAVGHLIWIGEALPFVHGFSIASALQRGGFERVVLHCEPGLDLGAWSAALGGDPRLERRPLAALAGSPALSSLGLSGILDGLPSPAAKANLLRLAALAAEGGVYLDTDTVTLASLDPLRGAGFFCGVESVAFPAGSVTLRRPLALGRGVVLHGLRAICAEAPGGARWFRRLEPRFHRGANNAVLGARPGHPFVLGMLETARRMSDRERRVRFALGTHLLQRALQQGRHLEDVVVHPPSLFYPLGPEISRHWFKTGGGGARALVSNDTRVVHWYASVRVRAVTDAMDAAFVRRHRATIPFCELVLPLVP